MPKQAAGLSYAVPFPVPAKYFGQLCLVVAALTVLPLAVSLVHGETKKPVPEQGGKNGGHRFFTDGNALDGPGRWLKSTLRGNLFCVGKTPENFHRSC